MDTAMAMLGSLAFGAMVTYCAVTMAGIADELQGLRREIRKLRNRIDWIMVQDETEGGPDPDDGEEIPQPQAENVVEIKGRRGKQAA